MDPLFWALVLLLAWLIKKIIEELLTPREKGVMLADSRRDIDQVQGHDQNHQDNDLSQDQNLQNQAKQKKEKQCSRNQ